ncbi:hypothetical protein SAMN04515667_2720 [Formosa sp. Hel1_31_208]|uniref:hypothetical protein n=1 Tax=Formosa sp. Hel1_31_208 TaxID=1798225 RepID=UPI00087BE8D3|nr:hypothetical protein [Formosa sp. Hel1_31_208]SDS67816.1 hypothetical protein SAMN04515667_2720 [Formosa sp. Hel1_31_208]
MSFITKLKSALGNSKTNTPQAVSDTTDAIIDDIEHDPFAISESNVFYAGLNELGGYYFFQTIIVGTLKVKSKNGGQLTIIGTDFELQLDSDSIEFESDPTDVKGRSITKIDFQIEEADAAKIDRKTVTQLELVCKKHKLIFTV